MNWIKAEDVTPEIFQPGIWVIAYIFPASRAARSKAERLQKVIHASDCTDLSAVVHFSRRSENIHAIYLGPHPISAEVVEEIHRASNQAIYENTLKTLDE